MKITLKEVKHFFSKKKNKWLLAIIIIAIAGLIISACLIIFFPKECVDDVCFSTKVINCEKSDYTKENGESIIQYQIKGKTADKNCRIIVKIIKIKKGSVELDSLEGKSMDCMIPLGVYLKPEENTANCHGLLKEGIQEIIIQRMYSQIKENLGQISKELIKVI